MARPTLLDWHIEPERNRVVRNGEVRALEPKAMDVLVCLLQAGGEVVSVEQLLDQVWRGRVVEAATVHQKIAAIRRVLGKDAVHTVARRGYHVAAAGQVDPVQAAAEATPRDSFVGRQDELHKLTRWLTDAEEGAGGVVFVHGEAGIGKTRIVEELAGMAEKRGTSVIATWCDESGMAPAYWPWAQALRSLMAADHLPEFVDRVRPHAGVLATVVPEVAAHVGELPDVSAIGADELKFLVANAIAEVVGGWSAPLLLTIDDLHRADEASLLVLRAVARVAGRSRVLVVCNYRSNEVAAGDALSQARNELLRQSGFRDLPLAGLSRAETGRLLEQLGCTVTQNGLDDVYGRTDGNVLFVSELGRATDAWDGSARTSNVPDSVAQVVLQRCHALSDACREVLSAASVCGRVIDRALLVALVPADADVLAECVRAGFLTDVRTTEPRFTHALIRDAVYQDLDAEQRRSWHRLLAETIEGPSGQRLSPRDMVRAGEHRIAAGDLEAGANWFSRTWSEFYMTSDDLAFQTSKAAFEARCALLATGPADTETTVRTVLAANGAIHCAQRAGGVPRAVVDRLYQDALHLIRHADSQSQAVALEHANLHVVISDFLATNSQELDEATRYAEKALRVAERAGDDAMLFHCVFTLLQRLLSVLRVDEVIEIGERYLALGCADPRVRLGNGEFYPYPRFLSTLGRALAESGQPLEGLKRVEDSVQVRRYDGARLPLDEVRLTGEQHLYAGYRQQMGEAISAGVVCFFLLGDAPRCRACADEFWDSLSLVTAPHFKPLGRLARAYAARLERNWPALAEQAGSLRQTIVEDDIHPALLAHATGFLALARAHLGDEAGARVLAGEILQAPTLPPVALVQAAEALLVCDASADAEDLLSQADTAVDNTGMKVYEPHIARLRARGAHARGGDCRPHVERAQLLWAQMGAAGYLAELEQEFAAVR